MIDWKKKGAIKVKCDLKEQNQPAKVKTAFAWKVIFSEEFPVMIIKILKEKFLDECGDWRNRERKIILNSSAENFQSAICVR